MHRKWRGWLDGRFNAALLDANHTHFNVQHDAGEGRAAPDNIDQRVQDAIKGMTGGAIGLAMGVMSVATSLFFVGQKLWETSAPVRGLEFLGDYGSFVLALGAVAAYVPLNTFIAMKLGGLMERLNVRMQQAEGSYRGEMNTLLRRSFHVAASRGEGVQQAMHERHYRDIDKTWARLNTVNAGYMSFELIYNFVAARFIAYGPGLIPYMQGQINLKGYVTGAELVNSLIGQCSWFIQVMPAIATLRANSVRVIDLAEAIENVQQPQQHYGRTGQAEFRFASQHAVFGLALRNLELMHRGSDVQPFLTVTSLRFRRGEWSFVRGESGCGKTSLVKAINGLWPYGRGDIVFPENVSAFYATQDVKLPQVTLKQLVCLPGSAEGHSEAKVAVALHKAGLGDFIEHLDSELHDGRIWEQVFSGGQKQKLVAARILLHQPGLLFLDEATGALDHEAKIAFHRAIKDNCPGVTVISVMHDPVPPRAADGSEFYDSIVSIADGTATKQAISSLPAELTTLLDQPLPVRPWPKRGQRVKLTDR